MFSVRVAWVCGCRWTLPSLFLPRCGWKTVGKNHTGRKQNPRAANNSQRESLFAVGVSSNRTTQIPTKRNSNLLSLALSYIIYSWPHLVIPSYTCACERARTPRMHARSFARTLARTPRSHTTHARSLAPLAYTLAHTLARTHTSTHARTHTSTHARKHASTQARKLAHTHLARMRARTLACLLARA